MCSRSIERFRTKLLCVNLILKLPCVNVEIQYQTLYFMSKRRDTHRVVIGRPLEPTIVSGCTDRESSCESKGNRITFGEV